MQAHTSCTLQDKLGGETYALGKGLFVIPKDSNPLKQQNGLESAGVFEKKVESENIAERLE